MVEELQEIHQTLNQVLEQWDRSFPKRDPQNSSIMRETMATYVYALRNNQQPSWTPDGKLVKKARNMKDRAVFVCGHMKSGTTLLTNLLDGHPELTVILGDSHAMNFINGRFSVYNKIAPQSATPYAGRLKDWDTFWIFHLINTTGQKPFWAMGDDHKPYMDFLHYLDYWVEWLSPSDRSPFLAAVLAYYCANPRRPANPKIWVEKTPGNEEYVNHILKLFPLARFVHIVRDPRANLASLKRLSQAKDQHWLVEDFAFAIRKSIKTGLLNRKRLGADRYHILRYKDLVTNTKVEMRKIAYFLGINLDQALLSPTINGMSAKSNSMYADRRIQGRVITNLTDRWRDELDSYEQAMATAILCDIARRLGYTGYSPNLIYYYWGRGRQFVSRVIRQMRRNWMR